MDALRTYLLKHLKNHCVYMSSVKRRRKKEKEENKVALVVGFLKRQKEQTLILTQIPPLALKTQKLDFGFICFLLVFFSFLFYLGVLLLYSFSLVFLCCCGLFCFLLLVFLTGFVCSNLATDILIGYMKNINHLAMISHSTLG